MTAIPEWIDKRLDSQLNNKLTQKHVVETMLAADRPFFSITQLQSRLKPDVGRGTIRNRLDELCEIDVVAQETYPETITLYYINHPESEWPLPPEARTDLVKVDTNRFPTMQDLITFRDPDGLSTLVGGGFRMAGIMVGVGIVLSGFNIAVPIESSNTFVTAGMLLLILCLLLSVTQSAVTSARKALD